MKLHFERLADWTSKHIGGPYAFLFAVICALLWVFVGGNYEPIFTTLTFLFVFLIQNGQNRHEKSIHIKLNEIILALHRARNEVLDVEDSPEHELDKIKEDFKEEAEKAR